MQILLCLISASLFLFVSTVEADASLILKTVGDRYKKAPMVSAKVVKTLKQALLEKTKIQSGQFYFKKNNLRLNFDSPDQSEVIVDGKYVWMLVYPPKEMKDAPLQVTKTRLQRDEGTRALLNLLSLTDFKKHFNVKELKSEGAIQPIELNAKKPTELGLSRAVVSIDQKNKVMTKISYQDELGNETTYMFTDVSFAEKVKESVFEVQLPKGAEVTEI